MIIQFRNYRVLSDENGYAVARKWGNEWRKVWYFNTLDQAIDGLFEHLIKTETKDFILNLDDETKFQSQKTAFITKIREIKEELIRGLQDGE